MQRTNVYAIPKEQILKGFSNMPKQSNSSEVDSKKLRQSPESWPC